MDGFEFGRREHGFSIALVDLDFVWHTQFFEQPEHALRAGFFQMVDGKHGVIFSPWQVQLFHHKRHGLAALLSYGVRPAPSGELPKDDMPDSHDQIISATQRWLERAVIGLNLCPFAKAVHVKQQIRYVVSTATATEALLDDLEYELNFLRDADANLVDTTLLILPNVLDTFSEFADFLDLAEVVLRTHRLDGVLQIASFHPDYVFADAEVDDVTNYSNRSPYPMLHLLREASVSRATQSFPDAAQIFERNMQTLNSLGVDGWRALQVGADEISQDKT